MRPRLIRWLAPIVRRTLRRDQRIERVDVVGAEHLQQALRDGAGVLITANHSFHYDSYVMLEAADQLRQPIYTMTAWQVFAMSNRLEQWLMQVHGCFSVDREGADMRAFRQGVEILRTAPHPLLIFAEGDIYHTNDRVTPFREGAAAIALAAAKRAERPIVCVPCAVKCWYTRDPTPELLELMARLEERTYWRPAPHLPLDERIYRFAQAILSLKELEYLGAPQAGAVGTRVTGLAETLLSRLEERHGLASSTGTIPERVKELRRLVIQHLEDPQLEQAARDQRRAELDDLFFIVQLFSYPGDYAAERPSIERLAETLDKFEEDILQATYPAIRGTRRAEVRFGQPVPVPRERQGRDAVAQLTTTLESRVQGLLDAAQIDCSGGLPER